MKMLLVEDDRDLARVTRDYFSKNGYSLKVINNGQEALNYLMLNPVKLIILDIMLPGVDGFTICELVRQKSNTPIIIISAKTEEDDKIMGLELGADDYIEKPYSVKELFARAKAQLRRSYDFKLNSEKIIDSNLTIDIIKHQVFLNSNILSLTSKEFELLKILVQNKGIPMRKERLFNLVWGIDSDSDYSTLTVHINKLREKVENNPKNPERILTVWGIGYKYEGTV